MTKLSEDLKRMLAGLAYQDAGEFLSLSEKTNVLNGGSQKLKAASQTSPQPTEYKTNTGKAETKKTQRTISLRHIAFISNGDGINAPLDYAIDASLRQNAQIDLLIHDAIDLEKIASLEMKIRNAGVCFQRIQIKTNPVDHLVDYAAKQSSLIFMIAMPEDPVAKRLVDEASIKLRNRIHVPLVLINNELATNTLNQEAA